MTKIECIPQMLGTTETWVDEGGVHWLATCERNVRQVAAIMNAVHARFVTITAVELTGGQGFRLEYHWDLDGELLGFPFQIAGTSIESIYDLCEAVDWIEREVYEGFAVDFLGREYEPLLLRAGDKLGVNLHEVVQ
jgi:NADH:ubiquinone oxidoreductase subunit C